MNAGLVVRSILRNGRLYSQSFSKLMVSIHPEELSTMKNRINLLKIQITQMNGDMEILKMRFNNFEKCHKYSTLPKMKRLQQIIDQYKKTQ